MPWPSLPRFAVLTVGVFALAGGAVETDRRRHPSSFVRELCIDELGPMPGHSFIGRSDELPARVKHLDGTEVRIIGVVCTFGDEASVLGGQFYFQRLINTGWVMPSDRVIVRLARKEERVPSDGTQVALIGRFHIIDLTGLKDPSTPDEYAFRLDDARFVDLQEWERIH